MNMLKTIRVANIMANSTANGPGVRTVVHLAGCTLGCVNCFNKWMWPENGGQEMLVRDLADLLLRSDYPQDLTLSGGEPFEQADSVLELVLALKARNWLKSLFIYTGLYEHEFDTDAKIVFNELADYVVAGRYNHKLRSLDRSSYASSSNQVIYKRGVNGSMVAVSATDLCARTEILINPRNLIVTGLSSYATLEADPEESHEPSVDMPT